MAAAAAAARARLVLGGRGVRSPVRRLGGASLCVAGPGPSRRCRRGWGAAGAGRRGLRGAVAGPARALLRAGAAAGGGLGGRYRGALRPGGARRLGGRYRELGVAAAL